MKVISQDLEELHTGSSEITFGCMYAIIDQVYPEYNNDKPVHLSSHTTNKHNNTLESMLSKTKYDTAIHTRKQNADTHKSDTHINQITPDHHFIKYAKHVPIEDVHITADDKTEPET